MTLTEFLAARYAEEWSAARDRELAAGLDTSRGTRDADADRLLLAELAGAQLAYEQAASVCINTRDCAEVAKYDATVTATYAAWRSLQRLAFAKAAVFSDHPDFDQGWAS